MIVLHARAELDALLAGRRRAVVPTMGALHDGHAALVRRAVSDAPTRPCIVTVFVNPTQFDDPSDFARYPRTLDADAALCAAAGALCVFAPAVGEVYPPALSLDDTPIPAVATSPRLEDAHRPGHFDGVCRVVRRLFDLTRPDVAYFGEKDWQQLEVVRAMTAALSMPIEIIGVPTVRAPDGLAMSSRNRFLTPDERARATCLRRALDAANEQAAPAAAEAAMAALLRAAGARIDYAVVRDASTLLAPMPRAPCRAVIAARLGAVRLLDNAPWEPPRLSGGLARPIPNV